MSQDLLEALYQEILALRDDVSQLLAGHVAPGRGPADASSSAPAAGNHGGKWTDEAKLELVRRAEACEAMSEICVAMGRTRGSIRAQIARLHFGSFLERSVTLRYVTPQQLERISRANNP